MFGSFSFSANIERHVDDGEKRTTNAIIFGKMSQKFELNYPFSQEGQIALFMKISITQIIIMDDDNNVQDILQKPFIPDFKKVYFVARYSSMRDFKYSEISGEKENKRNRLFFERFQEEFVQEIQEVCK